MSPAKRGEKGTSLPVDARPLCSSNGFNETTCFGFRRKSTAAVKSRSKDLPQDAGAASKTICQQQPVASNKAEGKSRLCGAGAILQPFSSDILATDMNNKLGSKERAGYLVDESQPRIMASYSDIMETKAEDCDIYETKPSLREGSTREEIERDGDREDDGADSIEEDDTFNVPTWAIDPHDIYFISKSDSNSKVCRLGKGDFGPVYLGLWKDEEVAVKLARQRPISLRQERAFQGQVAALHALSHPNLVQLLGACCWKGGKRSVLVTEYMDKGDLRSLLEREDLTSKFAWVRHGHTIALDIARGLAYLHGRGIVHGRLKSSNVLMNRAGVAKLADPALLKLLSHCKDLSIERSGCRSPVSCPATAPEVMAGQEPTMASDVFSFGVVLWELLSMEKPDRNLRLIRTPEEAPARIAYMLECCLSKSPSQRPSADKIVAVIAGKLL